MSLNPDRQHQLPQFHPDGNFLTYCIARLGDTHTKRHQSITKDSHRVFVKNNARHSIPFDNKLLMLRRVTDGASSFGTARCLLFIFNCKIQNRYSKILFWSDIYIICNHADAHKTVTNIDCFPAPKQTSQSTDILGHT